MKTLKTFLFKTPVYDRAMRISQKKIDRLERLKIVKKELDKWSDIPLSWQFTSLCTTLKIKPNEAAKNFLYELLLSDMNLEEQAKKLPLI